MAENLDETIETLTADIGDLRAPLLVAHTTFLRSAAAWAAAFWPEHAREMVSQSRDLAERHQQSGELTELKAKVQGLVEQSPELAMADVTDAIRSKWAFLQTDMTLSEDFRAEPPSEWYQISSPFKPDSSAHRRPPKILEDPTRNLLRRLEPVLQEYGYQGSKSPHTYGGPEYVHHKWSTEMLDAIDEYAEQHAVLLKKRAELKEAKRKRDEAQAGSLWDVA
jgi:hypothetical protein